MKVWCFPPCCNIWKQYLLNFRCVCKNFLFQRATNLLKLFWSHRSYSNFKCCVLDFSSQKLFDSLCVLNEGIAWLQNKIISIWSGIFRIYLLNRNTELKIFGDTNVYYLLIIHRKGIVLRRNISANIQLSNAINNISVPYLRQYYVLHFYAWKHSMAILMLGIKMKVIQCSFVMT